jgi:uncharacterized membrane protein
METVKEFFAEFWDDTTTGRIVFIVLMLAGALAVAALAMAVYAAGNGQTASVVNADTFQLFFRQ